MALIPRILDPEPVLTLDEWIAEEGGAGLAVAMEASPAELRALILASGLRGRGGAGFPTGTKWDTIARNAAGSPVSPTVVVNGAEGEPGCFKDRMLIRTNPFRIVEGALVAARGVGAKTVIFALKDRFGEERSRLEAAVAEVQDAGWTSGLSVSVFAGPSEYLYGEETALLEALDGRPPFPRIAPPFRRGVEEVAMPGAADPSRSAVDVELAGPGIESVGPPTLVENVETVANLTGIAAHGADWFRAVGTEQSPGTIVCTVSGRAPKHGVGEFAMGTPLHEVLGQLGGVTRDDVQAVMVGVSSALLRAEDLDVALTYEDFARLGSGLGTAGFVVIGGDDDLLAVAAGAARFLAVESCGQCTPCKQDGRDIADRLAAALGSNGDRDQDLAAVHQNLVTVTDGARCNLASQQQAVVGSILDRFPEAVATSNTHARTTTEVYAVLPILDLVDGRFVLDATELDKQPDWTFDAADSGQAPADRLGAGQPSHA